MIDNIFDKLIKRALKGFIFRYNPESWNRLEDKLEKSDEEDMIFDALVSGKLKSYSVPVAGNSFARFEKKYLKDNSPDRKLYYYITAVAAVLAFAILTFMNIGIEKDNINNIAKSDNKIENSKTEIKDMARSGNKTNDIGIETSNHEKKNNEYNNVSEVIPVLQNVNTENTKKYSYKQFDVSSTDYHHKADFGLKYSPVFNNTYNNTYNNTPYYIGNNRFSLNNEYSYNNELLSNLKLHIQILLIETENNKDYVNEDMENKKIDANKQVNDADLNIPAIDSFVLVKNAGRELAINSYFSPDIDIINTPNDLSFNVPGYVHVNNNMSAGLSLSYKKGQSELETGFEYFRMSYSPRKNPVKLDRSIVYLDKISFNNIGIPFNYKYHFVKNKKWDFYTVSGVSVNVTTKSKYEFIEKINKNGNEFKLTKLAQELQKDIHFKNSIYAEKDYLTGALEGGKLGNNFYLAVNAGFGVKRKLGNGFSVYFEPQYKYIFNKFNPNNDLIQKVNFKFGLSKIIKI